MICVDRKTFKVRIYFYNRPCMTLEKKNILGLLIMTEHDLVGIYTEMLLFIYLHVLYFLIMRISCAISIPQDIYLVLVIG